jgi:uncharacterized protein YhbP (UPF0306 family)
VVRHRTFPNFEVSRVSATDASVLAFFVLRKFAVFVPSLNTVQFSGTPQTVSVAQRDLAEKEYKKARSRENR